MEYALLIYSTEDVLPETQSEAFRETFYEDFRKLNEDIRAAGAYVESRRLQTVDTATTVSALDGELTVTDGPFAETKETLAGFYLIEARDLDEALAWAGRLPSARIGRVEVRPVYQYTAPPEA